jgi:hypothetical protein
LEVANDTATTTTVKSFIVQGQLVEQLPPDPKFKGLNPADRGKKFYDIAKSKFLGWTLLLLLPGVAIATDVNNETTMENRTIAARGKSKCVRIK